MRIINQTFPFARLHVYIRIDKFIESNQQLVCLNDETVNPRSADCLERIRQTSHDT